MADRAPDFDLRRDGFGRLVLVESDGTCHEGVVPVRAFPLAAPDDGLSIVGSDGHELAWIDAYADLPPRLRTLLDEELAQREFAPRIRRIDSVSTFGTPSVWQVQTDRGATQLTLKAEEDIRRLGDGMLLVASGDGVSFIVPDVAHLDRHSRRLLERFL